MPTKTHYLVKLSKPVNGVTHKALCQRAFALTTGKQLRSATVGEPATCSKCLKIQAVREARV